MSEELLAVQGEQAPVVEQQVETKVDPYEDQAREQGWRPKEEFEGDISKWKEPKEFVERGELFQKIDGLGKELKETRKALKMLQEHHTKVKETEYKRAVDELKALQKRHLEEGNSDGYLEASELLTDLKAEQKAREAVQQTQTVQPDERFTSWVSANPWYTKDPDMREYADVVGLGYANKHPGIDPEDVLKYVSVQVKSFFKDKFKNPNRERPSAVEGNSTPTASNKSSFELTDDERRVMNTFVRQNILTKDEYISQVKAMRGIK